MSNVVDQVNYRGTHLSLLQIPICARNQLEELIDTNGSSKASFTLDGAEPNSENAEELEGEVGWVCKICRLVFPSKTVMTYHKNLLQHTKGVLKLTQLLYYCSLCKTTSTTALEYRSHLEVDKHKNSIAKPSADKDDAEVADVVRQITALTEAAQPITTQTTTELPQKVDNQAPSAEAKTSTDLEVTKDTTAPVKDAQQTQHSNVTTLENSCLENTTDEKKQELNSQLGFQTYPKMKTPDEKERFSKHSLHEENKVEEKYSDVSHCNNIKEQSSIQGKAMLVQEIPPGTPVVCTQEMVSTYNDCSYNEHSISFITNPNYTPPAYTNDSYIPYNKHPQIGNNMPGGEMNVHRDYNQQFFTNQNTDYQYEASITSSTDCHLQNYCYGTYSPYSSDRKYQQPLNMGYLDNYHHQPEVNDSISNFGMESKKCLGVSNQLFLEPTPIKEPISASSRYNADDDGVVRSVLPSRSGSTLMQMDQSHEYMHNLNFHPTSTSHLPPSQVLPSTCEKVARTDANANISRSVPSSTETQSNYL